METLAQKLADLEEAEAIVLAKSELEAGTDPLQILDACREGMVQVGERYESGDYFVSDLMMAAEIFKQVAVMGDVPASLFAAGTPDDIRAYVRDLVRDVGPEGLLLCPGCDAPINTKPENMEAFVAAGREFGRVH